MINKNRVWEQFRTLAAFDSESFSEREIAAYLQQRLTELGLSVQQDDAGTRLCAARRQAEPQKQDDGRKPEGSFGNIFATWKGTAPGDAVLFSAHMDTVSPGRGKQVVEHENQRVTSDGRTVLGADDLTGIAAILEALTVIREQELPHPTIEVLFTVAEEPYCRGASLFDFSVVQAKTAYVLDLDGAIGTAAYAAPTIEQFQVRIQGKSAHAGFEPEKGISAIAVAAQAIAGLSLGRREDGSTVNLGTIRGGSGKNIVPEEVVIEGEVRSRENGAAKQLLAELQRAFETAAAAAGARVTFLAEEMVSAYRVREDAEVIRHYREVLRHLGYGPVRLVETFGGSDNNALNAHGIEGIVIANGMHEVHTTKEYFNREELEQSAEIVVGLATKKERS